MFSTWPMNQHSGSGYLPSSRLQVISRLQRTVPLEKTAPSEGKLLIIQGWIWVTAELACPLPSSSSPETRAWSQASLTAISSTHWLGPATTPPPPLNSCPQSCLGTTEHCLPHSLQTFHVHLPLQDITMTDAPHGEPAAGPPEASSIAGGEGD